MKQWLALTLFALCTTCLEPGNERTDRDLEVGKARIPALSVDVLSGHAVVRSLVPVSLRTPDAHGEVDNRVSAMIYELPVHVADPVERLKLVKSEMTALKQSHMAEAGEVVTAAGDLAPPMLVGLVTRAAMRVMQRLPQRSVNTVTTNVPGPQFPVGSRSNVCDSSSSRGGLPLLPASRRAASSSAALIACASICGC